MKALWATTALDPGLSQIERITAFAQDFGADLPHAHDAPLKAARLVRPRSSDQLSGRWKCPAPLMSADPSRLGAGLADPTSRGYADTVRRPRQRGPDPIVDVKVRRSRRAINQTERCATVCRGPYHHRARSSEQEYLYLCSGALISPAASQGRRQSSRPPAIIPARSLHAHSWIAAARS
jgi:hypothetical protein